MQQASFVNTRALRWLFILLLTLLVVYPLGISIRSGFISTSVRVPHPPPTTISGGGIPLHQAPHDDIDLQPPANFAERLGLTQLPLQENNRRGLDEICSLKTGKTIARCRDDEPVLIISHKTGCAGFLWWSSCARNKYDGLQKHGALVGDANYGRAIKTSVIDGQKPGCGRLFGIFRWPKCKREGGIVLSIGNDAVMNEAVDSSHEVGSLEISSVKIRETKCGSVFGISWWSKCNSQDGQISKLGAQIKTNDGNPGHEPVKISLVEPRRNCYMKFGLFGWPTCSKELRLMSHEGTSVLKNDVSWILKARSAKIPDRELPRCRSPYLPPRGYQCVCPSSRPTETIAREDLSYQELGGCKCSIDGKCSNDSRDSKIPETTMPENVFFAQTEQTLSLETKRAPADPSPSKLPLRYKDCFKLEGEAKDACKRQYRDRSVLKKFMYILGGSTALCIILLGGLICLKRCTAKKAPLAGPLSKDTSGSSTPHYQRPNLARVEEEEGQRPLMTEHPSVGHDGVHDGWTKWISQKRGAEVPTRYSPPLKAHAPRIPSLVLPTSTLGTVRKVSGMPTEDNQGRQKLKKSKVRWNSTV